MLIESENAPNHFMDFGSLRADLIQGVDKITKGQEIRSTMRNANPI